MPTPSELIEALAMKLSPMERVDLADRLWLSVHSKEEVDAAWDVEIARRIAEVDSGAVPCLPWDTVMAEQRAKLRWRGATSVSAEALRNACRTDSTRPGGSCCARPTWARSLSMARASCHWVDFPTR